MKYFNFFELTPSYYIDLVDLKKRYYTLSRSKHPDRYATSDAETRSQAEQEYSEINKAYETLKEETTRLQYLLHGIGVISEGENYQLAPDFLMEMLELNELKLEKTEEAQIQITQLENSLNTELESLLKDQDINTLSTQQKDQLKDLYYRLKYVERLS